MNHTSKWANWLNQQKYWVTGSVQYWGLRSEYVNRFDVEPVYCLDAPITMPTGSIRKTYATYGGWDKYDGFHPTQSREMRPRWND